MVVHLGLHNRTDMTYEHCLTAEPCLNVQLNDVSRNVYKNAGYYKYTAHSEWVRQGGYYGYRQQ